PSRGELVRNALECQSLPTWLERLCKRGAHDYAGFNLLASDGLTLWHLHHGRDGTRLQRVAPGLHGLSNATLDTPWPKLLHSRRALESTLAIPTAAFADAAWSLLADDWRPNDADLPETGVGLDLERLLSAPFIASRDYGTRASTWLAWHAEGRIDMGERSFGPHGRPLDERWLTQETPRLPG
ncbi:NRDE family protein, partial [Halomonas sp. FL8]